MAVKAEDTRVRTNTYKSTNYGQFQFLATNRDVNRGHVEKLKKSIEQFGNFTENIPLVFNEKLQAIDGQHRFTALKELGLPIYYTIVEGLNIKHARQMNITSRGWGLMDYAKSYAEEHASSYVNFLTLVEEFPDVAPSVVMVFAIGKRPEGISSAFRDGAYILPDQAMKQARIRLQILQDCIDKNPVFKTSVMGEALLMALDVEGFDVERLLKKLDEAKEIPKMMSIMDSLRAIEDVYNHHYSLENRVRLF